MKLSTKGRYGARAMLDLALHGSEDVPVALNSIADRQNISEQYLEQIFSALRKSGLVESIRGAQGGYRLSRRPELITLGEILRTLEGGLNPVDCVTGSARCPRYETCVMKDVWQKVSDSIDKTVDAVTLRSLMDDYYRLNETDNAMYYI